MAVKKLKCRFCGERKDRDSGVKVPLGFFCSFEHAIEHGRLKGASTRKKTIEKKNKSESAKRKESIKKRTGKNGFYDNLKTQLHAYIKHVLRKGEPCYTCGKKQSPSDSGGAFHVGHFIPQKQVDPRRFMLINLRMQCYKCNVHGSGMRAEYRQRLVKEIGIDKVEWLECDVNHKSLKEQYPEISDIKSETARYRKFCKK